MPDPFVHLHVASGYSLRYGASHPQALVARAAEHEMDTLALTDRDGTYGAVKFARACQQAGLRPVLGVDLAHHPTLPVQATQATPAGPAGSRPRTPVRGGAFREPVGGGLPRVNFLATGGRAGWAALCRLVSATHLSGERGVPVLDVARLDDRVLQALAAGHLMVILGPASEFAAAATRRRDELGQAALAPWLALMPRTHVLAGLVSHRLPGGAGTWGPGTSPHAARMAGMARQAGIGAVLTNAVRYADRGDAATVDVLDAARRLVALDRRHVDRGNAEGYLKSGKEMALIAEEILRLSGVGDSQREARRLLAHTRSVADRCALDPRSDLGLGEVHFPEFEIATGGVAPRVTPGATPADALLRARCEAALGDRYGSVPKAVVWKRLDDELEMIRTLGYASYFLTVGDVTDLIREMGVRCAARGSGAGSIVNYLLGVCGVDPIRYRLLMERFLSPRRAALPDIDVDVESARRLEVYERILDRYSGERCVTVSMMDTYRVRHAVRDVGAALGMPPGETDAIAKAFPHIRARDARAALRELPELRASGLTDARLDLMFQLVERLDGLPRHVAMHPCGVLLSDATLLDRTPVEASYAGFPMSQFDKDDVEDLGLLKLDVLGIRMQSSMAHAVAEIKRTEGVEIDLDDQTQVPLDDPETYALISSAKTLGIFQIESPGQRELVGKSGIENFEEIITDISLFRPGPVKSDMITPYLEGKQGWKMPSYLHEDLHPILSSTQGVVVFHEQVIEMIAQLAGIGFAEADEKRRALGDVESMAQTKLWFFPRALARGYPLRVVERVWAVLEAFASFGFCKAHAAAFALPTFQSAWLKTHWPAHFLAGVLTYDPGMYPKRLILDDARQLGLAVLGLDINASEKTYAVEYVNDVPGIRLALAEVKGINEAEVERILAARPFHSLTDFWHRARVSRPILERLVLAGAFDGVYAIGGESGPRGRVTRRDLLLQIAELDRHTRALDRASRGRGARSLRSGSRPGSVARAKAEDAAARNSSDPQVRDTVAELQRHPLGDAGVWAKAAAQSKATAPPPPVESVQLALELGDEPAEGEVSGLPEMSGEERMRAELEILGLDVSRHAVDSYAPFLEALGVVRSRDLLARRSRSEILVAGVKVATQTPPIRSGRRVIFLTLDDSTGPVDATFFEDAQGSYAATVFASWLLVVRGELRRTGHRGVSVRATGCWELPTLAALWQREGIEAVRDQMAVPADPEGAFTGVGSPETGQRRVMVHSSGFQVSPYSDIKPAGSQTARKLWHRSPGSPG
ncbi:DNA polymerase III subunit alpha [Nocardioides sp.]|uniref:DNA polymerase III subunit alpha n=1 Tax=Nocardioides sp. TaxID=35761 RepID=UPI00356396E4